MDKSFDLGGVRDLSPWRANLDDYLLVRDRWVGFFFVFRVQLTPPVQFKLKLSREFLECNIKLRVMLERDIMEP